MEGLLIAEELHKLPPVPLKRLSWRFPDAYTFVLPLAQGALWLYNRPPNARMAYKRQFPAATKALTGFQDLLIARAGGSLMQIEQLKLDRVVKFHFAGQEGFITTAPVVLVVELTGRNCNLILTDASGVILAAAKEVDVQMNRFRQVHSGMSYTPPPPYHKLDPHHASEADLLSVMQGQKLKALREYVDGMGPELTRTLVVLSGLPQSTKVTSENISQIYAALQQVVKAPALLMQEALGRPDLETLRRQEARAARLERLNHALERRKLLLEKRIDDIERTKEAAEEAEVLREQAGVLLAYVQQVRKGMTEVTLYDFAGEPLELPLDPKLTPTQNAEAMFSRARKREQRAQQAETRTDDVLAELMEIEDMLTNWQTLSETQIDTLSERYLRKIEPQFRAAPFIRYTSPQGYSVLVGRNAKGNDELTFKIAKSLDIWLHAQGYQGSHVIIQAGKKEVPFDTVLYAAQLAAAYSKASQSDNVPIDYTLKKHVWKVKGMPPGAVHFSQQKTVYVTPSRRPATSSAPS